MSSSESVKLVEEGMASSQRRPAHGMRIFLDSMVVDGFGRVLNNINQYSAQVSS